MSEFQLPEEILSLEQYKALPDHTRAEVFGGQFCYLPATSRIHRALLTELTSRLGSYVSQKQRECQVIPAPFDVILSNQPFTLVHPDIVMVCNQHKLTGNRCCGAPDFVLEIVSPGYPADDYVRKLFYYHSYKVQEYWIVDPNRRSVFVNDFRESLFNLPYTFDSIIKVNIFDDLYINFSAISTLLNL